MDLFPGSYCRTSSPLVWVSKLAGEGEQRLGTKPEAKHQIWTCSATTTTTTTTTTAAATTTTTATATTTTTTVETASLACTFWLCCSVHSHHGMIVIGNCTLLTRFHMFSLRWCLPATRVNGCLWHTWRPGVIYLKGAESPVTVCRCIALPGFQHFKRVPHRIPGLVFGGSASRSKSLSPSNNSVIRHDLPFRWVQGCSGWEGH